MDRGLWNQVKTRFGRQIQGATEFHTSATGFGSFGQMDAQCETRPEFLRARLGFQRCLRTGRRPIARR